MIDATARPDTEPVEIALRSEEPDPMATATDRLDDWLEVFDELYSPPDRDTSPELLWIAATAHCSQMGEAIRRHHFGNLMESATHAFCWMCSFLLGCRRNDGVFHISDGLSDIVALKYPGVCGHCKTAPCQCNPVTVDAKKDKAAEYLDLLALKEKHVDWHTWSISKWLNEFRSIYGGQCHILSLETIGFHFLEEAGEELSAIRSLRQLRSLPEKHQEIGEKLAGTSTVAELVAEYDHVHEGIQAAENDSDDMDVLWARTVKGKMDMVIELADTFSWFCTLLNKVQAISVNCDESNCRYRSETEFETLLRNEYVPDGEPRCPTCGSSPCVCVFYQ